MERFYSPKKLTIFLNKAGLCLRLRGGGFPGEWFEGASWAGLLSRKRCA